MTIPHYKNLKRLLFEMEKVEKVISTDLIRPGAKASFFTHKNVKAGLIKSVDMTF